MKLGAVMPHIGDSMRWLVQRGPPQDNAQVSRDIALEWGSVRDRRPATVPHRVRGLRRWSPTRAACCAVVPHGTAGEHVSTMQHALWLDTILDPHDGSIDLWKGAQLLLP